MHPVSFHHLDACEQKVQLRFSYFHPLSQACATLIFLFLTGTNCYFLAER